MSKIATMFLCLVLCFSIHAIGENLQPETTQLAESPHTTAPPEAAAQPMAPMTVSEEDDDGEVGALVPVCCWTPPNSTTTCQTKDPCPGTVWWGSTKAKAITSCQTHCSGENWADDAQPAATCSK